jgi:predicted nuclease of predicted toxin-antitoxin system
MKFKTDENLPLEVAALLNEAGFDARSVADENLSGSSDDTLAVRLRAEGRILLTLDLDFANIRAYPPGEHPGMIVFRLKTQDKVTVIAFARRAIMAIKHRSPSGELWIVEHSRIRFRTGAES